MNEAIKKIVDVIQRKEELTELEKNEINEAIKAIDKALSIAELKIQRLEKDKSTVTILLEETIEELKQKRKAIKAQNRELEIEASLERIRARTMTMKSSGELTETSLLLFQQFKQLGEDPIHFSIGIFNEDEGIVEFSATWQGNQLNQSVKMRISEPIVINKLYQAWKDQKKALVIELAGKELQEYARYRNEITGINAGNNEIGGRRIVYAGFFSKGLMSFSTLEPRPPESIQLLERFAGVFDLIYTRFLDLQKAEAQARDAHIEAALERVRTKAMAMHKSEDLNAAVAIVFEELNQLNIGVLRCGIGIFNKERRCAEVWTTTVTEQGHSVQVNGDESMDIHPLLKGDFEAWLKQEDFSYILEGEDMSEYYRAVMNTNFKLPESQIMVKHAKGFKQYYFAAMFESGSVFAFRESEFPEEAKTVMKRFAKVFNLTYKRFLDIQKAEAQAREAIIESALEKLRSSAMAMRKSTEVMNVAGALFEGLQKLGFTFGASSIIIMDKESGDAEYWIAGFTKNRFPESYKVTYFHHPYHDALLSAWNNGKKYLVYTLAGEEKKAYDEVLFTETGYKNIPEQEKELMKGIKSATFSIAFMKHGALHWGPSPLNEEKSNVLQRFATVFEQSYTRFLDLQQAEAQAREAQIEAGLERVRTRTMAMQKSNELLDASLVLYQQMKELGEPADQLSIGIVREEDNVIEISATLHGDVLKQIYRHSKDEPYMMNKIFNAWKTKQQTLIIELNGEELNAYNRYRNELTGSEMFQTNVPHESRRIVYAAFFSKGMLALGTSEPRPEESLKLLSRFAAVFDHTYTRFLDLTKAETQAREAQIEVAVERVRAKALAMHKSEDLHGVVVALKKQLLGLNIHGVSAVTMYLEQDDGSIRGIDLSGMTDGEEEGSAFKMDKIFRLEDTDPDLWIRRIWNGTENYFVVEADEADFERIIKWLYTIDEVEAAIAEKIIKKEGIKKAWLPTVKLEKGKLNIDVLEPPTPEIETILLKMGAAFDLAYKRFLDLTKAEAQAREAQIEAALERVRASAMAMHKSDDLKFAVATVFEELDKLNLGLIRCGIAILDKEKPKSDIWITVKSDEGSTIQVAGDEPLDIHPLLKGTYDAWRKQEDFSYVLQDDDLLSYYQAITKTNFQLPISASLNTENKDQHQYFFNAVFQDGSLFAFLNIAFTDEAKTVMKRFANVFNLTYKRFLDLQKAEAQTREAQIEAALERVRASAMAMHKSEDLHAAVTIIFEEFKKLNLNVLRCGIGILNKKERTGTVWATSISDKEVAVQISGNERFDTNPFMSLIYDFWQKQEDLAYTLEGRELINYYEAMNVSELRLPHSQLVFSENQLKPQYYYAAMFSAGGLYAFREIAFTEEDIKIMKRFASVINLTYNRFLDLQKAETQAREAQIEASLERVRSRSMAMHSSEGLLSVTQVLREQMALLGEKKLESILIHIYNKETDDFEAWYSFRNPEDPNGKVTDGKVILEWSNTARARMDKEKYYSDETDYTIVANREILTEWYKYLERVVPEVVEYDSKGNIFVPDVLYYNYSKFPGGALLLITNSEASESSKNLLKRSANVFNLAYTRFIDLRKAEAQAKEAIKQASLDRVRGEIASMRSTADLDKITPLIWNELTTLGIQFSRCGVFIMDEVLEQINTHLSTPDGKAIAAFHLPYNTQGIIKQILEHWYKKDIYREYWDEAAFNEWIKNLLKQGAITSPENYNKENRPTNLHLHFFPFLQGMLYVGSEAPLGEEGILVVKTLAGAFSSAYARYEDFNKLEIAKQQVDETLIELKATQKQLIQSEKMASLGELTAGIAHEIQNPLNFVNNFAEVNNELISDLQEEINKDNIAEVKVLATTIHENDQKIIYHGKRADAIVKGMLQHSRSSSGQKEPTDINTLTDEYLRLAYHGLRAKDKTFNATIKTDYDEILKPVSVVPQDIGRVILNLITNAFYAVNERSQKNKTAGDNTYEPTVTVTTKKSGDTVQIIIKDNGGGISQKVLDKIFQPFFTTKPTGEGTGLGLSLSYDIVKAHGGELKVKTKEGEGSEFIIQLNVI